MTSSALDDRGGLVALLLNTVARQSEQMASIVGLEAKIEEILGLLKSMAHVVTHTSSRVDQSKPADHAQTDSEQHTTQAHDDAQKQLQLDGSSILPADLPDGSDFHYFLSVKFPE